VDEARAALLLPVDQDLGVLVDLLQVEVAAVEEDLGGGLGEAFAGDRDVVAERPADGGDGFVQRERARRALRREPFQGGHSCAFWP
jgi:hypothetical protein